MRIKLMPLCAVAVGLSLFPLYKSVAAPKAKKHVLVVTVTKGFRHDSIAVAEETIKQLGDTSKQWDTDFARTDDDIKTKMTAVSLKKYDAIIFANTTGVLPLPDPKAFLAFVSGGKGFAAMHSGGDTFHQFPGDAPDTVSSYVKMLGGEFVGHNRQCQISGMITDPKFPSNVRLAKSQMLKMMLPQEQKNDARMGTWVRNDRWNAFDEIYLFKNVDREHLHTLIKMDAHPDDGSADAKKPGEYMVSWSKSYGKGRVFYTSLGHRKEMWADPLYQSHVTGGILFALGLAKGDVTPN